VSAPSAAPRADSGVPGLALRPSEGADQEFLRVLYADVRADELMTLGWSAAQRDEFCRWQFDAQDTDYRRNFPAADFDVIVHHDEPVGRFSVARMPDELSLLDMALLSRWRGRGWGAALLRQLMDEAARTHRPIRLHVELNNPRARQLYERLGFRLVSVQGLHQLFEWVPPEEP